MAQAGYTPIQLYFSSTPTNTPSAGNLSNGELAINIADGKLFYKDSGGVVKVIAGTGGTGVVAGSNTQIQFNNNGVFGASANLTWDGSFLTAASIKNSALTSGRVTYAGASGLLTDSANMTFNGTRLTVADFADSSLTAGRVTYATTSGNLTDSTNLTFDGTTLTAANITSGGSWTFSGGTANGVLYLNGSKVATSGSALTFDGSALSASGNITSGGVLQALTTVQSSSGADLRLNANGANRDHIYQINGSEQMRLTTTGLGIGTSSPSAKLVVASGNTLLGHNTLDNYGGNVDIRSAYQVRAANTPTQLFVANSSGTQTADAGGAIDFGGYQDSFSRAYSYARIQGLASASTGPGGYLSFMAQNTGGAIVERMRITSGGDVGIGTSSPSGKLHVVGRSYFQPAPAQTTAITLMNTSGGDGNIQVTGTSTTMNYSFNTYSTAAALYIQNDGNVGIGTSSPSYKLDVNGTSNFSGNMNLTASSNINWNGGDVAISNSGTNLIFKTYSGSLAERMRITSAGDVGIGTSSPSAKLHVAGTVIIDNADATNELTFSGTQFTNVLSASTSGFQLGTTGAGYLAFLTNNTERARITSTGTLQLSSNYQEGVVTANTSTAYTISLASGTVQILTLTGNCTFTFPTATSGQSFTLLLKQDATGSRTVTWPAAVKWPSGTAPTITSTASKLDKYVFISDGTNWYGSTAGQNYTV